jgi:hypothetical protein
LENNLILEHSSKGAWQWLLVSVCTPLETGNFECDSIEGVGQPVKLVQLFDRIFHEMEASPKVSELRDNFKPQVV